MPTTLNVGKNKNHILVMFTFLSVLGIILFIALVASLFLDKEWKENLPILTKPWGTLGLFAVSIFMALSAWLFFYSYPGYQYFLVYPNGRKAGIVTEGYKFAPFASVQEWNKNIDIKTVAKDSAHITDFNSEDGIKELEGVMKPIDLRFIDQVTGTMNVTTRFTIPIDEKQFIDFAIKYRNVNNLVHNTLIPTISEQAKNTGFMYAAQDYISGAGQGFKQTFEEQLENGAYVVVKQEKRDTIFEEIISKGPRHFKEIQTSYSVQKVMDPTTHKPKIIPNEISLSGIVVSQVIVDNVVPDPEYQNRLKEQKGESAKRQLEQQKIATAKIEQQRVIAEGEVSKAKERVTQEVEQVKTLIPFETEKEKEKAKLASAQIAKERETVEALTLVIREKAQADANKLKVLAGLTPQESAEWKYKTAVDVAEKIAGPQGITFPSILIQGQQNGSKDGGTLLESLIGAELAKSMLNKPEKQ